MNLADTLWVPSLLTIFNVGKHQQPVEHHQIGPNIINYHIFKHYGYTISGQQNNASW